ncbi:MAG: tRNA (adenosine(37)-N6)-threonylcarbamoyltransferase complex ATPase subunit type 1 TsaE [Acidimicrobiales bacterium]|nr:tRNA (adenosine(37)-N6)-threonylcarbamoyltransferase complex ATPase subunit type 1 TsaE [Acidimicrobiales bacterium]
MICVTTSAPETRALAGEVAEVAEAGDLLLLVGDLGTGKTTFVQGFGRGLGVRQPITSPTFVLVHSYEGRLELFHADAYRLCGLAEVEDLGLTQLIDQKGVAVVEWGELAAPLSGEDYLEVRFELDGADEDRRRLRLRPVGPRWQARGDELGRRLRRFQEAGEARLP